MTPFWFARLLAVLVVAVFAVAALPGAPAVAAETDKFRAQLTPLQEAPVCSSTGSGTFRGTLSADETTIAYELTYDFEGTVTQAHIHLGQKGVSGGISVWLCQTAGSVDPTGLSPTCPASPGTVTGTFTKANVVGPVTQGIAGSATGASDPEFAELLRAMRHRLTYANVHSNICPGGEVRGQIKPGGGLDED